MVIWLSTTISPAVPVAPPGELRAESQTDCALWSTPPQHRPAWSLGEPCHKGTLSSIARTSSAVALRHYARTGGQQKVKWPPPFGGGHPRACGGTSGTPAHNDPYATLLLVSQSQPGKPVQGLSPRLGGTDGGTNNLHFLAGLSPRLRGNRQTKLISLGQRGSIPAPAGEPSLRPVHGLSVWVYPRACGGTFAYDAILLDQVGLSPRLRGNPQPLGNVRVIVGSIPAPAGEPPQMPQRSIQPTVYPRACGGTSSRSPRSSTTTGLSPRLRGNPPPCVDNSAPLGSIPAPAGEPGGGAFLVRIVEVYPRACGGTP